MPFDPLLPRSFTAVSIRMHAPAMSGVYGLSNARSWLFIGESDNIQQSLMAHLREPGEAADRQPTGFVFELCPASGRQRRQDRLVQEYAPVGNRE